MQIRCQLHLTLLAWMREAVSGRGWKSKSGHVRPLSEGVFWCWSRPPRLNRQFNLKASSRFKNNYFAEMWSDSEEDSYLRLIDLSIIQIRLESNKEEEEDWGVRNVPGVNAKPTFMGKSDAGGRAGWSQRPMEHIDRRSYRGEYSWQVLGKSIYSTSLYQMLFYND